MGPRHAHLVCVGVDAAGPVAPGPVADPGVRRRGHGAGAEHPGGWLSRLVYVDSEGTVTIIECKLKANPQIRREIVG